MFHQLISGRMVLCNTRLHGPEGGTAAPGDIERDPVKRGNLEMSLHESVQAVLRIEAELKRRPEDEMKPLFPDLGSKAQSLQNELLKRQNASLRQILYRNLKLAWVACGILSVSLLGVSGLIVEERSANGMRKQSSAEDLAEVKLKLARAKRKLSTIEADHQKTRSNFDKTLRARER